MKRSICDRLFLSYAPNAPLFQQSQTGLNSLISVTGPGARRHRGLASAKLSVSPDESGSRHWASVHLSETYRHGEALSIDSSRQIGVMSYRDWQRKSTPRRILTTSAVLSDVTLSLCPWPVGWLNFGQTTGAETGIGHQHHRRRHREFIVRRYTSNKIRSVLFSCCSRMLDWHINSLKTVQQ